MKVTKAKVYLIKMTPLISDGVQLLEDRLAKHPTNATIDFKE